MGHGISKGPDPFSGKGGDKGGDKGKPTPPKINLPAPPKITLPKPPSPPKAPAPPPKPPAAPPKAPAPPASPKPPSQPIAKPPSTSKSTKPSTPVNPASQPQQQSSTTKAAGAAATGPSSGVALPDNSTEGQSQSQSQGQQWQSQSQGSATSPAGSISDIPGTTATTFSPSITSTGPTTTPPFTSVAANSSHTSTIAIVIPSVIGATLLAMLVFLFVRFARRGRRGYSGSSGFPPPASTAFMRSTPDSPVSTESSGPMGMVAAARWTTFSDVSVSPGGVPWLATQQRSGSGSKEAVVSHAATTPRQTPKAETYAASVSSHAAELDAYPFPVQPMPTQGNPVSLRHHPYADPHGNASENPFGSTAAVVSHTNTPYTSAPRIATENPFTSTAAIVSHGHSPQADPTEYPFPATNRSTKSTSTHSRGRASLEERRRQRLDSALQDTTTSVVSQSYSAQSPRSSTGDENYTNQFPMPPPVPLLTPHTGQFDDAPLTPLTPGFDPDEAEIQTAHVERYGRAS